MEANEENLAHVAELIEQATAAGLKGADWVASLGVKRCCEGYNGIGPEFLPARVRDLVTGKLALFEPAALPHDLRNDVSDGTREKFLAANDEFRWNCLRLVDLAYPQQPGVVDDVKRARAKAVAEILYCFVSADGFGWKAWLEAHERAKARDLNHKTSDDGHQTSKSGVCRPESKTKKGKTTMKKLTMMLMLAACAAAMMTTTTGCRAVTVENYGEEIARDADDKPVTLADGRIQTVKKGWRVHHNQHWMTTRADAITASVKPEDISFAMNGLNTQPSEELNKLVGTSLDGLTKLAVAVGEAYVKIAGGGAQADTALNVAARVANYFRDRGGDVTKAAVATTADNKVQVSDGSTCIECDAAGNCTDCTLAK